jgi:hypothetical protein
VKQLNPPEAVDGGRKGSGNGDEQRVQDGNGGQPEGEATRRRFEEVEGISAQVGFHSSPAHPNLRDWLYPGIAAAVGRLMEAERVFTREVMSWTGPQRKLQVRLQDKAYIFTMILVHFEIQRHEKYTRNTVTI